MSTLSGIGSIIGGIRSFLPTSTTTDTSGNSHLDANTSSDTANVAGSLLQGATDTAQSQVSGTTTNQTQNTTQATQNQTASQVTSSASDAALKAISSNIGLAQSNATDDSKTSDLVTNILTQAAMTFAPTKSLVTGAGLYNSPTMGLLTDFAKAQATGAAAGAVLNYKTGQQSLAESAASDLARATATQATSATGSSTATQAATLISGVLQSLFSNTAQNTSQALLTANQGTQTGHQEQNTTSQQSGSSGSGLSIICTELVRQEKMDKATWVRSSREFQKYSKLSKDSYYFWAHPAVLKLRSSPDSLFSRVLAKVMVARCAKKFWARAVINTITFFAGLVYLATKPAKISFEIKLEA